MAINKKNNQESEDIGVKIDNQNSSLAEFVKRPLPTEEEVREFEEIIHDEVRGDDVEESLNEIYQDDDGEMVDVKKMDIKKGRGFFFWFFSFFILLSAIAAGAYYLYDSFYLKSGSDATAVDFFIEAKTDVVSGEEFVYTLHYKNSNVVPVRNLKIELAYPKNFIFLNSEPANNTDKKNIWELGKLGAKESGELKIRGKILAPADSNEVIFADFYYEPENFSSSFSKKTSFTTKVKDIGLNVDFDYISSVLVNEEESIVFSYNAKENNFIDNFRFVLEPQENIKIISLQTKDKKDVDKISEVRPGVWQINGVSKEKKDLVLKISFIDKKDEQQKVNLALEKDDGVGNYFVFYKKEMEFEVMKNDLNLSLIINGSRDDQGVDAGSRLNYSISFVNKGETDMKNVVIMAVLDSDFLNWGTLNDKNKGLAKLGTISWSKDQIPELELVKKHEEGVIDFSIDLNKVENVEKGQDYQVQSYVQFSVGKIADGDGEEEGEGDIEETPEAVDNSGNRSNVIVNKINSNLSFEEYLKYFNDDNIPVGTGPHPPRVGEETSYRVYWNLTNSLHDLEGLTVSFVLPHGITWQGRDQVSVGSINYDTATNQIVWNIGRLPASIRNVNAEFSLGVVPTDDDKNKIMIVLPGSKVSAVDTETKSNIEQNTKAKTTKLEDDEVGRSDGIVD